MFGFGPSNQPGLIPQVSKGTLARNTSTGLWDKTFDFGTLILNNEIKIIHEIHVDFKTIIPSF